MRKLEKKWTTGGWPKRLEWLEIDGIRGWSGQRLDFNFPFVAIVGENGAGKSTVLQALASVYKSNDPYSYFASDFFPDTAWDKIRNAAIKYSVREGNKSIAGSIRKPTERWRGNPERREREVRYLDLRRIQPISSQIGYARIAKGNVTEVKATPFDNETLERFSTIVGKKYVLAKHSLTDADVERRVPVVQVEGGTQYSGFHQGAGESTIADLLKTEVPKYSLLLIDEIETSLHPRAQRRLIRDLAELARLSELQIVVTTHSPYVLDELPTGSRVYIMNNPSGRQVVIGVSPFFAMTQMDEESHPELDIYVEDEQAQILIEELLAKHARSILKRSEIIPYGAASVGKSLGTMVANGRFPRPSRVFLDGDQEEAPGCLLLPGDEAPERVVFAALKAIGWPDIALKVSRSHSELVDSAELAMTMPDHHNWLKSIGDSLALGGNAIWRAMSSVWVDKCLNAQDAKKIVDAMEEALG
ncbi:ATP-dependent nuclease [Archangium sp.]|uniref:ATP-dependent nuclease n=1 Tax=Archangium sp. TaxID=1872627 RepID=UPI00389A05A7